MSDCKLSVVTRSVESLNVLHCLKEGNVEERKEAFIAISNLFLSWYMGFGSPKEDTFLENSSNGAIGSGDTSMLHLIEQQLPAILRLSLTAPMKDVREHCCSLLEESKVSGFWDVMVETIRAFRFTANLFFQSKGLKLPRAKYSSPSRFIPRSDVSQALFSFLFYFFCIALRYARIF